MAARKHLITHPTLGVVTWQEIVEARKERGKVCSWCFQEVPLGRKTRCGKQVCNGFITKAYSWTNCRRNILKKQKICALCLTNKSTEVDHIIPVSLGGTGDEWNLRALCHSCHKQETQRLRILKEFYVASTQLFSLTS